MKLKRIAMGVAVLLASGTAMAEIVLYENDNFNGRSFRSEHSANNLGNSGFNDMASSAHVRGGKWQLCSDAYFRGNCVTLGPGRYNNLRDMGLNDKVSSARALGWTPDGGGGWGGGNSSNDRPNYGNDRPNYGNDRPNYDRPNYGNGNWGSGGRAVLYEYANMSGRSFVMNSSGVPNFGNTGFNDKATSLRVESGYWLFCSDAHFQGDCRTFGPGDYPFLPGGLNGKISSGRRIANDYPYRQNPNW